MDRARFNFIWETTAIFFAVVALLFWRFAGGYLVLRWVLLVAALGLMVVVAYLRLTRLHHLPRDREEEGPPRPPFGPLEPPSER